MYYFFCQLVHVHDLIAINGYLYHKILMEQGGGTADDLLIYTSIITCSNKELMKYLIGIIP